MLTGKIFIEPMCEVIGVPLICLRFFSQTLLADLEAMLQLVCRTQAETKKQLELEKRLNQLRIQWKIVEDELVRQKKRTASMLPEIVDKQKKIDTRKILARKLNLYCDRMGRKLFGNGYKCVYLFAQLFVHATELTQAHFSFPQVPL